jgi:hypothetical protein
MVSCQEPSPLKGSRLSYQCHPHDAVLVNALFFVSMGVEARCCPCHSAAHCRHMKRQPFLCNGCPCHGRCHLRCRRQLRCRCQLCLHCCCRCPLPSPLAIAIAVAVNHCCCHICCVAISHCCCCCPCRRPLPSPSPLAIAVAISIGHHHRRCRQPFLRVVPLARQELYSNNLSKECLPYYILFGQWAVH